MPFRRKHSPDEIRRNGKHQSLQFDIAQRKLNVIHEGKAEPITAAIDSLNFNSSLLKSENIDDDEELLLTHTTGQERKLLCQVLAINFFFFVLEIIAGFISGSLGLVPDSRGGYGHDA